ncbi:hypothetical protein, partial [Marinitoga sp. 1155]|uniref:hypothetical protein n=1 Tax=Marinitoga sp. 1155 TaxID=1428448 RepID=UPI001E3C3346
NCRNRTKKLNKTFYSRYGIKLYYLIFIITIIILVNNSALLKKQRKNDGRMENEKGSDICYFVDDVCKYDTCKPFC